MDPEPLDDHVAFVTGASRGIGRAIAVALASRGCNLALASRSPRDLRATADECEKHGAETLIIEMDVTDRDGVKASIEHACEELGGLDILINNAGRYDSQPVDRADMADWEEVVRVNLLGAMYATRCAAPHLKLGASDRHHSAVVNIASVAGKMSFAGGGAYCGSKHGLVGLSGSTFEDLREHGIKVCALNPGFVNTEMVADRNLDPDKMIQPEDVARSALHVITSPETVCPTEIKLRPQRSPYLDD